MLTCTKRSWECFSCVAPGCVSAYLPYKRYANDVKMCSQIAVIVTSTCTWLSVPTIKSVYSGHQQWKDGITGWFRERERNVLFNDALNTFYLRLYGIRHMAKDHSDSERGNPLPPHGLLLSINSKGSFICTIPQTA